MEKERLKFCIERFDNYYNSVNNKSAVFLGLGTFTLGGLIASVPYLSEHSNDSTIVFVFLTIPILLAFAAMLIVITASIPFLSKKNTSLFYFNSIATKNKDLFINASANCSNDEELNDLREQVHVLSQGLRGKFKRLRWAGILYSLMFASMIPVIILALINFK